MTTTVIIDCGIGNLCSVENALRWVSASLDYENIIKVTNDPAVVKHADRIILPGVGAFGDAITGLTAITGLREILEEKVIQQAVPFLGICVGMQIMASTGYEFQTYAGLDWIKGKVIPFDAQRTKGLKIPHIGWNPINWQQDHPILQGLEPKCHMYFVHSYHMLLQDNQNKLADCQYGYDFPAMIAHQNMVATQFHPEKSHNNGLRLLENFIKWTP